VRLIVPPIAALIVATCSDAFGFVHISEYFFDQKGAKWGQSADLGTGAVVTWSFVGDGVGVDPVGYTAAQPDYGVDGGSAISTLRANIDTAYGSGAFDAAIQNAFDTWASVANIRFVQTPDSGELLGASSAVSPHIRIGAYAPAAGSFLEFAGAIGIAPPGYLYDWDTDEFTVNYSQTLAGDVIFNLNAGFIIAPGNEDDPYDIFPPGGGLYQNDLEGLFLHELGHAAIGLDHPPTGPGVVMYAGAGADGFINRQLSLDDIAGAQFVYGLPLLTGDANHDGVVDAADFLAVEANFGTLGKLDGTSLGDANGDGRVDGADWLAVERNFGAVLDVPIGVPVPEPGTAALVAAALAFCGRRLPVVRSRACRRCGRLG